MNKEKDITISYYHDYLKQNVQFIMFLYFYLCNMFCFLKVIQTLQTSYLNYIFNLHFFH